MNGPSVRRSLGVLGALLALAGAPGAHAYTVAPGDVLVRPMAGASVNVVRYAAATRATPQGGMILGLDVDYAVSGPWAITAALRPVLSADYVDGNLGLGVKHRMLQLDAPLIPYVSLMATAAVGGPVGAGALHVNVGGRAGGGVDYFVMRGLAVGLELGLEVSALTVPTMRAEATADVLAGLSWRF